ncbi:MAG: MarR family transcriptional regulator [Lachnospiraceae bacterium]|nr:MarR family transcriptional regulator [Lachnospiraceae bacterium]
MNRDDKISYFFGSIFLLANKLQIWGDTIIPALTTKQFFLLIFILKMNIDKPTIKDIADFTGTSRQNVKKMLERLAALGYVSFSPSESDARALIVTLTEKTFTFFSESEQKGAEALTELFKDISDDELEPAIQIVNKLFNKLEGSAEKSSPP